MLDLHWENSLLLQAEDGGQGESESQTPTLPPSLPPGPSYVRKISQVSFTFNDLLGNSDL